MLPHTAKSSFPRGMNASSTPRETMSPAWTTRVHIKEVFRGSRLENRTGRVQVECQI